MRRSEKEITDKAEVEEIIRKSLVCRLAMVDGQTPYMVPLCFGYQDNTLYLHSAREGKKLELLKTNPNVCFEFDVDTELQKGKSACDWGMSYRSVIGFGEASLVEDVEDKRHALDIIMHQYAEGDFSYTDAALKSTAVIKVDISAMTGKRSA